MIDFALRRATDIKWQVLDVDKSVRARLKQQWPCVVWFTGLSGAGKSTIANLVDKQLSELGRHATLLDGDNLRHGLNRDLGFTSEARVENIRRDAEVARLFVDAGMIALVSLNSPLRSQRAMARSLLAADEFIEIHVVTPLSECERRDPKGLYRKARAGQLPNFTGIHQSYEAPEAPRSRSTPRRCLPRLPASASLITCRSAATCSGPCGSARSLSKQSGSLKTEVENFLNTVRAA